MNILFISLAPVFIIAIYIYIRDKYEKEPIRLLLYSLLAGIFIIIPVIFVEMWLSSVYRSEDIQLRALWEAFVVAGFTEEVFKFAALYLLIWKNRNFNEKFDGIVYAVFVSLGFAALENMLYVYENGMSVGVLRAFTAVPAHALFGVAMGFYFGLARFYPQKRLNYMTRTLLFPILLHGLYDFMLMAQQGYLLLAFLPYIVWLWYNGFKKMKMHSDKSPFRNDLTS